MRGKERGNLKVPKRVRNRNYHFDDLCASSICAVASHIVCVVPECSVYDTVRVCVFVQLYLLYMRAIT